ncbi:MAG TPA: hydroxymethylbilane synthase [Candidatus Baltobacteraceae bacterium]|nr:hydroxymethylbilane synthase [Candidatus Baltobacteraceae bacterium]
MKPKAVLIATRGSPLALAQANAVLAQCRDKFPSLAFELKIVRTTGDELQGASLSHGDATLPRGLFTKELEAALLKRRADLAVHSLKDLPTELPEGLKLGAVAGKRADARDVLLYKEPLKPGLRPAGLPPGLTVATSSTRRKAQLLAMRSDFKVIDIRGNVGTRLRKLAEQAELDGTILAAAGLARLGFKITDAGRLTGEKVPAGILAVILELDEMLPCVGQAAIGLEVREGDDRAAALCRELNDEATFQCVTAERAFLRAMGGGCQSPVAAFARIDGTEIELRAVSFLGKNPRRGQGRAAVKDAAALGREVAAQLG